MVQVFDPKDDSLPGYQFREEKCSMSGLAGVFSAGVMSTLAAAWLLGLSFSGKEEVEVVEQCVHSGVAINLTSKREILDSLKAQVAGTKKYEILDSNLEQDREKVEDLIRWIEENPWQSRVLLESVEPSVNFGREIEKNR